MLTFADKVIAFCRNLKFESSLPEGITIMNPFIDNNEVLHVITEFYRKYYSDYNPRHFMIGIPGILTNFQQPNGQQAEKPMNSPEIKNKWFKTGFFAHGVLNVTPGDSFELCKGDDAIIIDVREPYLSNFKAFKVDQVFYIPLSELEKCYKDLPDDKPLIFADTVGLRSRESVLFLNDRGYTNVANMAGGIVDWERDGLPVTTDTNGRLSGSCMCQLKFRERKKSS